MCEMFLFALALSGRCKPKEVEPSTQTQTRRAVVNEWASSSHRMDSTFAVFGARNA